MKKVTVLLLLLSVLHGGETIDKRWETSANCMPCHTDITKRWRLSRHANSHFSKNDLYRKTLLYIVKKNPTNILDEIKIECAKCHNPRATMTSVSNDDKLSLLIGHNTVKKEYSQALNSKNMQDGVNCVVCHNIDQVHRDKGKGSQGYKSISFGKQGTMFGPFDDAVSPYHKTEKRDLFSEDNPKLCFACHFSARNHQGIQVYGTGKEYMQVQSSMQGDKEGCKKCHMSTRKKGVASNYAKNGKSPKIRMVREHRFASVDNSDILNTYIDISHTTKDNQFVIELKNNTPHHLPTGYGLREILLTVNFFDNTDKKLRSATATLGTRWKDKEGETTIPHLAYAIAEDTRLPGMSTKKYYFDIPESSKYLKYVFSYRLINNELAEKIGVEDRFFLKEYVFLEKRVHL